jgi:hypothetical protein
MGENNMKPFRINCLLLILFTICYCTTGCNTPANASVGPNLNNEIKKDISRDRSQYETVSQSDTEYDNSKAKTTQAIESLSTSDNKTTSENAGAENDNNSLDKLEQIMEKLSNSTKKLKSYNCTLRHLYTQPMFETKTLRIGKLFYQKDDKGSRLLVRIDKIQQDDEKPLKQKEEYYFDGYWFTQIEHETKQVKRFELAKTDDPNGPLDAFELMSQNFPIIGFTNTQNLRKDFDITIVDNDENEVNKESDRNKTDEDIIELQMKVKKDSKYAEDYSSFDFHIDKKTYLPKRIIAKTTDHDHETLDDFYTIDFIKPNVNKKISSNIFKIKIPRSYNIQTKYLQDK